MIYTVICFRMKIIKKYKKKTFDQFFLDINIPKIIINKLKTSKNISLKKVNYNDIFKVRF